MEQLKTDNTLSLKEPELDRYLKPSEQVIWRGQPGETQPNPKRDIYYSILISAAIFVTIPLLELLALHYIDFGVTFWLVLVVMMFLVIVPAILMFLVNEFKPTSNPAAAKVQYLLTNERVIIMNRQRSGEYRSVFIPLDNPEPIKLIENRGGNGSGTIAFGRSTGIYGAADPDMSLVNIPNVLQVYQLIQQTQSSLQQRH